MHAVVCIKQVPDSLDLKINPETGTLIRAGVMSIINQHDQHALEEALRFKDAYGGRVTVITMGPPAAVEALRESVALGADEGILLTDRLCAGADTLATSRVLARAIEIIHEREPVDIVFAGKQTTDSDTAQTGPGIATRLGYTQLTNVMKVDWVDWEKKKIQIRRLLEDSVEVIEARMPALLAVVKEINKPRRATLPGLLRAARYEPPFWNMETLGLTRDDVGIRGSPTVVAKSWTPEARGRGEVIKPASTDEAVNIILDKLGLAAATPARA